MPHNIFIDGKMGVRELRIGAILIGDVPHVQEEIWWRSPGFRQHGIPDGPLIQAKASIRAGVYAGVPNNPCSERGRCPHYWGGDEEMVLRATALLANGHGSATDGIEILGARIQARNRDNMIRYIGI
jgi:hypothetical protein